MRHRCRLLLALLVGLCLASGQAQAQSDALTTIAAALNHFWATTFAEQRWAYQPPAAVLLVEDGQHMHCGAQAVAAHTGPFYCVATRTIVIERAFLQPALDAFGPMVVITAVAHEWGHHLQVLQGITAATHSRRERELQADCFAGAFLGAEYQRQRLQADDLRQARRFLYSIGARHSDAATDMSAHGTPGQRVAAFDRGVRDGVNGCRRSAHPAVRSGERSVMTLEARGARPRSAGLHRRYPAR